MFLRIDFERYRFEIKPLDKSVYNNVQIYSQNVIKSKRIFQIINILRIFNNFAENREISIRKSAYYPHQNFDDHHLNFSMILTSIFKVFRSKKMTNISALKPKNSLNKSDFYINFSQTEHWFFYNQHYIYLVEFR